MVNKQVDKLNLTFLMGSFFVTLRWRTASFSYG